MSGSRRTEHRGYYYGFANEGLWPLCHAVDVPPVFRSTDFRMYQARERAIRRRRRRGSRRRRAARARAGLSLRARAAAASGAVARRAPSWRSGTFRGRVRVLRTCPWGRELLEGLLASNIVGFQTPDDCREFSRLRRSASPCRRSIACRTRSATAATGPPFVPTPSASNGRMRRCARLRRRARVANV